MTTETPPKKGKTPELTAATVKDYLMAHSDFFEQHPDMLDHLHISHDSGGAVSLVEKQVSVLRERNGELRKRLGILTDNARDNDKLHTFTCQLALELLEARSLDEMAAAFERAMREDFKVEHSSMILFDEADKTDGSQCRIEPAEKARAKIGALLKSRSAICGTLRKAELAYLFRDADGIKSAVAMPLCKGQVTGIIAVGSSDAHRYTPETGTLFLDHIAGVMVRLIPQLQSDQPDP